jgi:CRISPR/Cas system-associated endonuclease Cas1
LARVAPQDLDHAFIFGNVSLTAPALRLLMECGVNLGVLSHSGRFLARITPEAVGWVSRRRAQYAAADDPAYALLSLGYGLLRAEIEGQLEAVGLDPHVGFLHVERPGRPALALDLLEEFRAPIVDRLVLRCANLHILRPEHFAEGPGAGTRLTPDALEVFLRQYDRLMSVVFRDLADKRTSYRRVLHRQARKAAQAFSDRRPYRAFAARL